ncbi:unnamed protein product [Orchesella dallaii]|uniref:Uncharacterized protein n=1 Tax=Orchesella dallaii TaxID=48710 RepID=A0ABP1R2N3_9HEXA
MTLMQATAGLLATSEPLAERVHNNPVPTVPTCGVSADPEPYPFRSVYTCQDFGFNSAWIYGFNPTRIADLKIPSGLTSLRFPENCQDSLKLP